MRRILISAVLMILGCFLGVFAQSQAVRSAILKSSTYYITTHTPDGRTIECIVVATPAPAKSADNDLSQDRIVGNGISCNWAQPLN